MQVEQFTPSNYEDRILKMKKEVTSRPHELCIERAKFFTDSYKTSKNEPQNIRFAKALYHLLTNMTIKIWENEFVVGNRCSKFIGTPLYPEVRVDTLEQDLDLYNNREVQRFLLTEKDKRFLKEEIIPYWKHEEETVKSRFDSYLNSELTDLMLNLLYIVDTNMTNGVGHFFPGHENVLKLGINGLIQKATEKRNDFSKDQEKLDFLESVIIVLEGVQKFIQRFSILAADLAENEPNISRKSELLEISEICSKIVPVSLISIHE